MKLLTYCFFSVLIFTATTGHAAAENIDLSPSFDQLDPRLPEHKLSLLYHLQVASGEYHSNRANLDDYTGQSGLNKEFIEYLKTGSPYRFNYRKSDFDFAAGIRLKEDWLGFVEGDTGYSGLQSSLTFRGKAIIRNKIEIYNDLTLFRSDSAVDFMHASRTGEFLTDPLLSYNYAHRGAVASNIDLFELQTDRALIKTDTYGVGIQCGRDRLQLKSGFRNGLLSSGLTRPVDMFYRLDYDVWRLSFTALAGQLTEAGKRYISVKRVSLELAHNLRIGATEAAAYADDPTAYINPIMLFYFTHRHRPTNDDNLIAAVDFSYTPFADFNIYGEFVDDDLIIFEGGASKYGFMLGLYKTRLVNDKLDLRLEYAHVRKWTYTHVSHVNAWEYRDQPLGFWLGPDAEELFGQLSYLMSPKTRLSLNFDYVRKGESDLFHPYEDEWGDKKPPFLSGIVEKSIGTWLDFSHEFSHLVLRGRAGYRKIENRHNEAGDFNNYFAHVVLVYIL